MFKQVQFLQPKHILGLALLMSGCASDQPPPVNGQLVSGDLMLRESQGIAQLGSRWQQGKQMVDQGQQIQAEAQAKMEEGRRMIEEGQKIMRETEEGYKSIKK